MAERDDWLVGSNRNSAASDRIYSAATDLILRAGVEAFSIGALAEEVHCSPATIYRQVGGKAVILEGIIQRASQRVLRSVRHAIQGLTGPERVVTAIEVALENVRAQALRDLMVGTISRDHDGGWVTTSPLVAALAQEIIGHADPLAAQYLVRITFALWTWPVDDQEAECELIRRFVGPSLFFTT